MHEPLDPSVEGSDQPVGIVGSIVDNPARASLGLHWHGRACDLGRAGDSARLSAADFSRNSAAHPLLADAAVCHNLAIPARPDFLLP